MIHDERQTKMDFGPKSLIDIVTMLLHFRPWDTFDQSGLWLKVH